MAFLRRKRGKVKPSFKWRTSGGVYISIKKMDSMHLFNVLKMIWNHVVPPPIRVLPFKPYYFDPVFYPPEYMEQAFYFIFDELKNRDVKWTKSTGAKFQFIEDQLLSMQIKRME